MFDTSACKAFMHNEWGEWFDNSPRYDFFDESDFLNSIYVPKSIIFEEKNTVMFRTSSSYNPQWEEFDRYEYYSVEWHNPLFIMSSIQTNDQSQKSILKATSLVETLKDRTYNRYKIAENINDDWEDYWKKLQNNIQNFRNGIEGNIIAKGNYSDLELSVSNYRYMQWQRDNLAKNFGILVRCTKELNYQEIVNTMQENDTLVFQEFKVRYKTY